MAEVVGCVFPQGQLPSSRDLVLSLKNLSWRWSTAGNSPLELFSLADADRAVLVWGGRPAAAARVEAWARCLLDAVEASDPVPVLSLGPQVLHSGIAYLASTDSLLCVSGRLGLYPLYLVEADRGLWFANYPGLLVGRVPIVPNPAGLAQLLKYGHCVGRTTASKDMMMLQPSEVVRYRVGGRLEFLGRFASPLPERGRDGGPPALHQVAARLQRVVADCISEDATLVQTSGGLDSRLLLAAAKDHPVTLMSFGATGSTDVEIGRELAEVVRRPIEHLDTVLPESQLQAWAESVALASGGEKSLDNAHTLLPYVAYRRWPGWVLLNGNGGEFTRAYWYDLGQVGRVFGLGCPGGLGNPAVARYLERRTSGRIGSVLMSLMRPEVLATIQPAPSEAFREALNPFREPGPLACLMDDFYIDVRHHRFVVLGLQLGGLFFERAHPYFDPGLYGMMARMPLGDRLASRFHRRAIGWLAPELLNVAWDKTGRPLREGAQSLYWAPKRWLPEFSRPAYQEVPFMNYGLLFRTRWRSWFGDTVTTVAPVLDPWMPASRVLRLWDEHLSGERDHVRVLSALISFGLWALMASSPSRSITSIKGLL